ncbi:hypothetical protein BC835DRAFT_1327997 [Cytidiella melzeri]|nr:hypothetical protein BC835DRAFT_1327997 [Cytidiella melzeri]
MRLSTPLVLSATMVIMFYTVTVSAIPYGRTEFQNPASPPVGYKKLHPSSQLNAGDLLQHQVRGEARNNNIVLQSRGPGGAPADGEEVVAHVGDAAKALETTLKDGKTPAWWKERPALQPAPPTHPATPPK